MSSVQCGSLTRPFMLTTSHRGSESGSPCAGSLPGYNTGLCQEERLPLNSDKSNVRISELWFSVATSDRMCWKMNSQWNWDYEIKGRNQLRKRASQHKVCREASSSQHNCLFVNQFCCDSNPVLLIKPAFYAIKVIKTGKTANFCECWRQCGGSFM